MSMDGNNTRRDNTICGQLPPEYKAHDSQALYHKLHPPTNISILKPRPDVVFKMTRSLEQNSSAYLELSAMDL
ncbi:hypothetical protein TgHK011_003491 [Trichoderma gracile]|nr:hypothetical protein TgHK011_003491 [Trichoderma gracile]